MPPTIQTRLSSVFIPSLSGKGLLKVVEEQVRILADIAAFSRAIGDDEKMGCSPDRIRRRGGAGAMVGKTDSTESV